MLSCTLRRFQLDFIGLTVCSRIAEQFLVCFEKEIEMNNFKRK